jgi:hypothetical protein
MSVTSLAKFGLGMGAELGIIPGLKVNGLKNAYLRIYFDFSPTILFE